MNATEDEFGEELQDDLDRVLEEAGLGYIMQRQQSQYDD